MSRRVRELMARRAQLQRRCEEQRQSAAHEARNVVAALARVDRTLLLIGRWASNPLLIAAGVGIVLLLGRSRLMRALGAAAGVAAAVTRIALPLLRLR